MKMIDWNEFKAALMGHDEQYVSIFEEIEKKPMKKHKEKTQRMILNLDF